MATPVRRLRGWLPWIGLALLAVALYAHRTALARAQDRIERMRPLALRAEARDRLIGTDLSHVTLTDLEGDDRPLGSGGGPEVVWLVDPYECPRCLSGLTSWRQLAREGGASTTTVLVDAGPREGARMRSRLSLPGEVRVDPEGRLGSSLGVTPEMPSLYLVVDADGRVLMSESRQASTSCAWSFPEQVSVLFGGGDAAGLRAGGS